MNRVERIYEMHFMNAGKSVNKKTGSNMYYETYELKTSKFHCKNFFERNNLRFQRQKFTEIYVAQF